jgi:hypothetical protein
MEEGLVKINPWILPHLSKFANAYLTLKASSLPKQLADKMGFRVNVYPKNLLLSVYKYTVLTSAVETDFRNLVGMDKVFPDSITCGALSLFKPVEIPQKAKPKIVLRYEVDYDGETFRITAVELDFGTLDKFSRYGAYIDEYFDINKAPEHFGRLERLDGKEVAKYMKGPNSKVEKSIYIIEKGLSLIGNLFYTLHSGNFTSDLPLTRLVEIVRGQGDTFDEVLENIAFVMRLSQSGKFYLPPQY